MSIEINTKNHQKPNPQENKPVIKNNNYNIPSKEEPSVGMYIVSFIIVMILWLIMEIRY